MKEFRYQYTSPTEAERRARLSSGELGERVKAFRRLVRRMRRIPLCVGILFGAMGTLVFGTGLSLCLVWENYPIGVALGLLGIAMLALSHLVYKALLVRAKKKYQEEILRLGEEIKAIERKTGG